MVLEVFHHCRRPEADPRDGQKCPELHLAGVNRTESGRLTARQSAAFQQSKAAVKSRCLQRGSKNQTVCSYFFSTSGFDTSSAIFYAPRMAKKAVAKETVAAPRLKSSSLLDTRVVYCGDNLERLGRMQKEEGRMMKPARFPILHSSFCIRPHPPATTSRSCSTRFSWRIKK